MKNLLTNNFAHYGGFSKLSRIRRAVHYSGRLNEVGIDPLGYKITLLTRALNEEL